MPTMLMVLFGREKALTSIVAALVFALATAFPWQAHADVQPLRGLPFGCLVKNVDFVDLVVDKVPYHVPAKDIFLMEPCVEGGPVKWFSVAHITDFDIGIGVHPRPEDNPFRARLYAHAAALRGAPKNDVGLAPFAEQTDENATSFVGFSDGGRTIYMRCPGNNAFRDAPCANYSMFGDTPELEYYFMVSKIGSWKEIDRQARAYVAKIIASKSGMPTPDPRIRATSL